ncbi:MAG: heme ABC transporter ATP-binding protein [Cryobacterium sp.]
MSTAPAPAALRLEAHRASVTIGTHTVLHEVDLALHSGEVVALVGPNGAGKSTLLHVLAGDRRPDTGRIDLDGRPVASYRPRELARLRAVLTQSNEVSFPFSVEEVVAMGRAPWAGAATAAEDDSRIQHAMADAELDGFAGRRVPELSGGERARVAYARVRAQDCGILMLDEPTASLDIRHQERLMQQLRAHAGTGGCAVVVLHDLSLAAAYADRVVLLENGRVRADGPPGAALTSALLSEVYRYPISISYSTEAGHYAVLPDRRPAAVAAFSEEHPTP